MYAGFKNLVRQFHTFVETEYNDYTMLCSQMRIDGQGFTRMDNFKPLDMVHMAENWEVNNSTSPYKKKGYLDEYIKLMQKDDSLCIGACLEHILTYAGFDESEQIEDVRNKIREYRELPDMLSTDDEAYRIRKQLTPVFYDAYYKVFMNVQ